MTNLRRAHRSWGSPALSFTPDCPHTHGLLALAIHNDTDYTPDRRISHWLALPDGESLRLAEALHHIDRALALLPDSSHLHGLRALVLFTRDDYRAALEAANAGLAIDPTDSTCSIARHEALMKLGRDEEAASLTVKSLQVDPEDKCAHTQLGQLALAQGDFDGAIEHAKAALGSDPHFAPAQSIYWTAAAHLNPRARKLAAIRGAFLRKLDLPRRVLRLSPRKTICAGVITLFAVIYLACFSLARGDLVMGWCAIAMIAIPAIIIAIPAIIWVTLHVFLIVDRPDRRASIAWGWWITVAATSLAVVTYSAIYYIVPNRSLPHWATPPLLAICPIISLILSAGESRFERNLFRGVAGLTAAFALMALWAACKHDREGPQMFLLASGAVTLVADIVIPYVKRLRARRSKASPK